MRCLVATVWAFVLLLAPQAAAGPWAREAGDVFVSLRIAAEESPSDVLLGVFEPDTFVSFYGELGLGRRLTLVADLGAGEVSRSGVGFLRYTLTAPDSTWQFAVDAGLGARRIGEGPTDGLVRAGISLGRGFGAGGEAWYVPVTHEGGWISVDAYALYDFSINRPIYTVETTFGLNLSQRFSTIFLLTLEDFPEEDLRADVEPSILYRLSDRTAIRAGVQAGVVGNDTVGLSLAIWQEF